VEKLQVLLWSADQVRAVDVPGLRSVEVFVPAGVEKPSILMGRGSELAGLVTLWLDSIDVLPAVLEQVPGDAYLVTESVPQERSLQPGLLNHFSFFPQPSRLTDEEFFHGWHTLHTPTTGALHPLRQGYVRDTVARVLTPGSPPLRAIVSEFFATEDYLDARRLFGSKEALMASIEELPLYADTGDVSSCPLYLKEV
jgi:hypothetical protein